MARPRSADNIKRGFNCSGQALIQFPVPEQTFAHASAFPDGLAVPTAMPFVSADVTSVMSRAGADASTSLCAGMGHALTHAPHCVQALVMSRIRLLSAS